MKRLLPLLLLSLCLVWLVSCAPRPAPPTTAAPTTEPSPPTPQAATGPIRLAVIPKGTTHEFWKSIHAGALKAGKELGVEIVWKGQLKEDNRDEQIKIVEDMTSAKMSGIVLAPLDDTALRAPVAAAKAQGIPVVIIDSGLKSEDTVSFVATDNKHGGQLAGEELIRLLGGKGKVVMLRYQEGSASTNDREAGFLEALGKAPGITVVSSNQYGGATTESAYAASENVLAPLQQGGKLAVDGIFCPNESTTFGMLRALQDGGFAGKVKFIGFDSSPKLVQALKDKQLNALVLQDPMNMGYLGVKTMVRHLRGEKVEARLSTGETLVTPANMNEPRMQGLLAPDFKQWLGE
jgi:ribose transport system substrate-binding protein